MPRLSGRMALVKGLTVEQNDALIAVQEGDLVLIHGNVVDGAACESLVDGGEWEDLQDDLEADLGAERRAEIAACVADMRAQADHESDEDEDEDEDGDEIPSEGMFAVSKIVRRPDGVIIDVQLTQLQHSAKPATDGDTHVYQILGKAAGHRHLISCGRSRYCAATRSISEFVISQQAEIVPSPSGDIARAHEPAFVDGCIEQCDNGFLADAAFLSGMVQGYEPLTVLPPGFQRAICPVCIGVPLLKKQQQMQRDELATGTVDHAAELGFRSCLEARRAELRLGVRLSDVPSPDNDDDDDQDDEEFWNNWPVEDAVNYLQGQWMQEPAPMEAYEQWDEAMDPNDPASMRSSAAPQATIDALPRKTHPWGGQRADETICVVCQEDLVEGQTLLLLPCGHSHFHEECVVGWLQHCNTCPSDRLEIEATVSPVAEEAEEEILLWFEARAMAMRWWRWGLE